MVDAMSPELLEESKRQMLFDHRLMMFIVESNKIEGIDNKTAHDMAYAHIVALLAEESITLQNISTFNKGYPLRTKPGMNVMVGPHVPPKGGEHIREQLEVILASANASNNPYHIHNQFETLHPYIDGNGRTGRAIWLWQMVNQAGYGLRLGFLHKYYYQSLQYGR